MEGENGREGNMLKLPEGCIAAILSLTSPGDAGRLSAVSSIFSSAAASDGVWERFLPSDYRALISQLGSPSPPPPPACSSKKELFLRLCDSPILIDGGTKSFSLEKRSGKKCYMIAPRDLYIEWAETPMYWKWTSLPESRFAEVAELSAVCWLEIRGKINTRILSPDTNYAAYFVFKWANGTYGFEFQPVEVSIRTADGETRTWPVYLDPNCGQRQQYRVRQRTGRRRFSRFFLTREEDRAASVMSSESNPSLKERGDGWWEVELGEFFSKKGREDGEVEVSVMEVKGGHWKSGLIIHGIEARPKEDK